MTPESGIPQLKKAEPIDIEDIQTQRDTLKNIVFQQLESISEDQMRILFQDIRHLERFLLNIENEAEEVEVRQKSKFPPTSLFEEVYRNSLKKENKDKKLFYEEFKFLVGGIINTMSLKRLREVLEHPAGLINLLHGRPYEVPHMIEKPSVVFKKTKPEEELEAGVQEKEEREDPEAQIRRAIEAKDFELGAIIKLSKNIWSRVTWEGEGVMKTIFKYHGLDVEVEFFKPQNEHFGRDFMIISYIREGTQKGIVIPKHGINLNHDSVFTLFGGWKADVPVNESNLLEFPEIEKRTRYNSKTKQNVTEWHLSRYGKLKKETYA